MSNVSTIKKILIVFVAAAVLGSCSQNSTSADESVSSANSTGTDQGSGSSMSNSDSTDASGDPVVEPGQTQDAEPVASLTAAAEKYEQDIGKNLRAAGCYMMDNIREWVETDLEIASTEVNKVLTLVRTYRESAGTYIADPAALKEFQDNLDSSLAAWAELKVALVSQDTSGLAIIPVILDGIQGADRAAKTSLAIPMTPPCT